MSTQFVLLLILFVGQLIVDEPYSIDDGLQPGFADLALQRLSCVHDFALSTPAHYATSSTAALNQLDALEAVPISGLIFEPVPLHSMIANLLIFCDLPITYSLTPQLDAHFGLTVE